MRDEAALLSTKMPVMCVGRSMASHNIAAFNWPASYPSSVRLSRLADLGSVRPSKLTFEEIDWIGFMRL